MVTNGQVRSVTHRCIQRGPDDWECSAWGSSGREQKTLHVVSNFVNSGRRCYKTKARTWYQIPLITFLVADPLRNPRVSGRPTAATGFFRTSRRNSGILGNMVKSKSKGVKGRMCRVLVASDTIYIPK